MPFVTISYLAPQVTRQTSQKRCHCPPNSITRFLTGRHLATEGLERRVVFSRADVLPEDLVSISDFSEQQVAFVNQQCAQWGEHWIGRVLMGDTQDQAGLSKAQTSYQGRYQPYSGDSIFYDVDARKSSLPLTRNLAHPTKSLLPDLICALEQGRVIIVDTTLMGELEQFLLTTVVARTLFTLRRALRSVEKPKDLEGAIRRAFGNDEDQGQVGLRTLADVLIDHLEAGRLPYLTENQLKGTDQLPYVNVVVEEAPSVLNPQRMKFGFNFPRHFAPRQKVWHWANGSESAGYRD